MAVADEYAIKIDVAEKPLEPLKFEKLIALKITGLPSAT